ncbi:helix-turn-helix domain-containing protein [Natrinema sp. DC36]|uniref:winged helix-turn-helix domain-containing protein n=1 Tax=Natrinema sp. DC36 TaxID=2878680 RepID=UPI001CF005D6|nr:helix-turn-helix domain-containing protein [Natrinema sp. DC36]
MTSEEKSITTDKEPSTDPADAFGALSDPLRVDILQALGGYHRETEYEKTIGFADLRRRVGVEDSGRFRYHLKQLHGNFVEKVDGGCRLTYAGMKIVAAILMGTYTDVITKDATELDSDCFVCDNPAVATYENGTCIVSCANDHPLFGWQVPPTAAADATLPEIVDVAELLARQGMERTLNGYCPECYHTIEPEVLAEQTEPPVFRAQCETCGARLISPVGYCLLADPRVAAFYQRHGHDLNKYYIWDLPFIQNEDLCTLVGESPVRVEINVSVAGETLTATVDETGHVTDYQLVGE